jgi:hypothetical protein
MEMSRVVILDSRPVVRDAINELTKNQTLLVKNTPGWQGSFTSVVAWTQRPPTA